MTFEFSNLKMPIRVITKADIVIVNGEVVKNRYGDKFEIPDEYRTGEIAIWGINVIYDSNTKGDS